jgi:glycosyltransferase involved in cell wall biosynthesis
MKIVHTEASLGWGGQEIRIREESKGLAELGHEVVLLAPAESNIYKSAPKWGIPAKPIAIGKKRISGVFALRRWIQANNPDVINTHSSTDTWLTALACQLLKNPPPIVRTRHISAPIPNTLTSKWLYQNAVDHIVTTGESLRQQVIHETGVNKDAVTSVPTGIDPERFRPSTNKEESKTKIGLDPNKKYIGIVATLRSWKGHAYLIEAFNQLEQPDWELLIIGDGPMREPLQVQAKSSGSTDQIHFVGQQSNPEDWMRALDIFCLPSYANEGVPQAILQAMFTALPIITTAVGAIPEAIAPRVTGIVIPKKDVSALSSTLGELIVERDLRHELGVNANHAANKNFSKNQMLIKMETIFSQTIKSSPSV